MPIPRYVDTKNSLRYEIILACPKCGWAIVKDRLTATWNECPNCNTKTETRRNNYS